MQYLRSEFWIDVSLQLLCLFSTSDGKAANKRIRNTNERCKGVYGCSSGHRSHIQAQTKSITLVVGRFKALRKGVPVVIIFLSGRVSVSYFDSIVLPHLYPNYAEMKVLTLTCHHNFFQHITPKTHEDTSIQKSIDEFNYSDRRYQHLVQRPSNLDSAVGKSS